MKKFVTLMLVALMLCASIIPAYAETPPAVSAASTISPRLSHCNDSSFYFTVNGMAEIFATYTGSSTFSYAKLTVEIEKRFLGVFWTNVDTLKGTNYNADGYFEGSVADEGSGTYRAKFKLEVFGTDGSSDVIEETIQSSY